MIHTFTYLTVKSRFLERFPEIKKFGVEEDADNREAAKEASSDDTNITELPVSA